MENINTYPSINKIIDSKELIATIRQIGEKFNLHIDQTGELYAEIRDILKGLNKSSDFVSHITNRLEIDSSVAKNIANELNEKIFKDIRSTLKTETNQDEASSTVSDLEQIGGFTIEPKQVSDDQKTSEGVESRDKLIEGIENPHATEETEPLVDHLLSQPVVSIEQKITKVAPTTLPIQKPTPKPSSTDLYREPIE